MDKVHGMLVYVQLQQAAKAYVKAGAEPKPDEWKASVVITDKNVRKAIEKRAKELDTQLSLKEVETKDFKDIYKVDAPAEAGDEVWVLTLRKSTELGKTGKPVPEQYRPRVFEKVGNTLVDVTATKLPANGSYGAISIDTFERTNGGGSLYLKNVLVTEMIEYVKDGDDYQAGSEFGEVQGTAKAEDKPKAKTSSKAQRELDDENENLPF